MKIYKYINVYIIYTRKELILVGLYLADILGIFVKYDFAKSVSNLKIWTDLFFFLLNLIFDNEIRVGFSSLFTEVCTFSS